MASTRQQALNTLGRIKDWIRKADPGMTKEHKVLQSLEDNMRQEFATLDINDADLLNDFANRHASSIANYMAANRMMTGRRPFDDLVQRTGASDPMLNRQLMELDPWNPNIPANLRDMFLDVEGGGSNNYTTTQAATQRGQRAAKAKQARDTGYQPRGSGRPALDPEVKAAREREKRANWVADSTAARGIMSAATDEFGPQRGLDILRQRLQDKPALTPEEKAASKLLWTGGEWGDALRGKPAGYAKIDREGYDAATPLLPEQLDNPEIVRRGMTAAKNDPTFKRGATQSRVGRVDPETGTRWDKRGETPQDATARRETLNDQTVNARLERDLDEFLRGETESAFPMESPGQTSPSFRTYDQRGSELPRNQQYQGGPRGPEAAGPVHEAPTQNTINTMVNAAATGNITPQQIQKLKQLYPDRWLEILEALQ